jgi:hypothetical protein
MFIKIQPKNRIGGQIIDSCLLIPDKAVFIFVGT